MRKSFHKKQKRSKKRSHRSKRRGSSGGLSKWRLAAQKHGYMKKGGKGRLPKKGTPEYNAIQKTAKSL